MVSRRVSVLLALAATVLAAIPPPATAAVETPASFDVQEVDSFFNGLDYVMFREVAWHPSGDYALVAGGFRGPSTDPLAGWSLLLRYDNATGALTPIVNGTGAMLFTVDFHPDGGHALIVGEKDTILRYDHATGQVRNLWAEFQASYVERVGADAKPPVFLARGAAYRPDGRFAIVTGSALIGWQDGTGFFSIQSGDMRYYKAIGIAPDSSYAIVEGGDTDEQGRARIGQLWFLGMTSERCARYLDPDPATGEVPSSCLLKFAVPYGLFEPNRSDASDVTFHPVINASFVYGYDDTHGTMMRIRDNGTSPDAKRPHGDYVPEWMQANHKNGKYTHMAFRPGGTRALVTALGEPQLLEFDGLSVRPILNTTICMDAWGHRCPELENVAWHPSSTYAVAVGLYGGMIKIVPTPDPEVTIESPKPSETIVDKGETTVVVRGKALATALGAKIDAVRVRVDEGPWVNATVVSKFNPASWSYRWNASQVPPGEHRLEVQAEDTQGHLSEAVGLTVYVRLPPPPLEAPTILTENVTTANGSFEFEWSAVDGAQGYEVQRAQHANFTFGERPTFPWDSTTFAVPGLNRGEWYFRVRAVGEPRPASEWSEPIQVTVTQGRAGPAGPPTDEFRPPLDPLRNETLPDLNETPPTNGTPGSDNGTPPRDEDPPEENPTPGVGVLAVLAAVLVALRRRR